MLVIPRFRAMRPVRIEPGVHFGAASVVGVANFATVELKCLTPADGDRLHSRNIGRSVVRKGVSIRPSRVLPYASTEDGHVRFRVCFRCDDHSYECCFAHMASCIWLGIDRTVVSGRGALFTVGHPGQVHRGRINHPRLFPKRYVVSFGVLASN